MKTLSVTYDLGHTFEILNVYPLLSILASVAVAFYIVNQITSKG